MLCLKKTPHRLRDNVLWRVCRPTYALCISSPRLPALQQALGHQFLERLAQGRARHAQLGRHLPFGLEAVAGLQGAIQDLEDFRKVFHGSTSLMIQFSGKLNHHGRHLLRTETFSFAT